MALQALQDQGRVNSKFKACVQGTLVDRLLNGCIEYLAAFFALQQHLADVEKSSKAAAMPFKAGWRRTSSVGANARVATSSSSSAKSAALSIELDELVHARLRHVATLYATILVEQSNHSQTHQERAFFETLYDFCTRVLCSCYDRERWSCIESELGRIFRSDQFNLSQRKDAPERAPSRPGQQENKKGPRRKQSVLTSMNMRSPMVATLFPTPKERMQRVAELAAYVQPPIR